MAGGKHRGAGRVIHQVRKGFLLSADERATVMRLRRQCRMSADAIARAIGRPRPDVEDFLNSPEAQLG